MGFPPWLRSRPVVVTACCLVYVAATEIAHSVEGRGKLASSGLAVDVSRQDLAVRLNVQPETFHMTRLQRWGTMVGAEGRVVRLRAVPARDLALIARQPWVAALSPLPGS